MPYGVPGVNAQLSLSGPKPWVFSKLSSINMTAIGSGNPGEMAVGGQAAFPIVFSIDRAKCVLESPSQFESVAVSYSNHPL
jgi:hypothetical protein